jgi:hypothetical protein
VSRRAQNGKLSRLGVVSYHAEQLLWARGGAASDPKSLFDGTVGSLIEVYQTHKRSPFNRIRFDTLERYARYLTALKATIGSVKVKHVTFDDIAEWQEQFADDGDGSKPKKDRAARMLSHFHQICTFGVLVLPKQAGCRGICDIFDKMAEARMIGSGSRKRQDHDRCTMPAASPGGARARLSQYCASTGHRVRARRAAEGRDRRVAAEGVARD